MKSVATLTIHNAKRLDKQLVAAWLRRQAAFLLKHGHEMAPRFRARYMK